tara:strand:- start:21 stop:686 length:666 start_codon:yes stop_codon:yes gene_type:complete
MSYSQDPGFSEHIAIKALRNVNVSKHKIYDRHDIMLFYCVMARLYAYQGSACKCIMTLKQLENCLYDCDMTHPVVKRIKRRAESFLAVICKAKSGSYIDEAATLVTPEDLKELVSIEKLYKVLHVAFHNKSTENKKIYRKKAKRDLLYDKVKEAYFDLPNPICGAYERGMPEQRVPCINEFLTIYTNEPRRAVVKEDDIQALEMEYPEITFNRNNLKFVKL